MIKNKWQEDTISANQGISCTTIKKKKKPFSNIWLCSVVRFLDWRKNKFYVKLKGYGGHLWYLAVLGEHIQCELTSKKSKYAFFNEIDTIEGTWTAGFFLGG